MSETHLAPAAHQGIPHIPLPGAMNVQVPNKTGHAFRPSSKLHIWSEFASFAGRYMIGVDPVSAGRATGGHHMRFNDKP